MLTLKTEKHIRAEVNDLEDNYIELATYITTWSTYIDDLTASWQKTDILGDHKSNMSFAANIEAAAYRIKLANARLIRMARDCQRRNAKLFISDIMNA